VKISVQKVKAFKDSGLVENYENVIKKAKGSKDELRINAAEKVQESVSNIRVFFTYCELWKVKKGYYLVPKKHYGVIKKVRLYIDKDGLFKRIKARWQKK